MVLAHHADRVWLPSSWVGVQAAAGALRIESWISSMMVNPTAWPGRLSRA
jgi:hypothetical protein